MKEFKEEQLKECINKQFEINWYIENYEDVRWDKKWLDKFETNKELEDKFIEWLKNYLKPFTSKQRLNKEIWWFILNYWLPRKDYE